MIDAWCKADDKYESAEQAELVLDWMEDLFLHRTSSNPKEMLSVVAYNMGESSFVSGIVDNHLSPYFIVHNI